jgi:hypothetical protein
VADIPERTVSEFIKTEEGLLDRDGNIWITPSEVSRMAGNTPEAVRMAIRRESLPAIRVSLQSQHFYYVMKREALDWIKSKPIHGRNRRRNRRGNEQG